MKGKITIKRGSVEVKSEAQHEYLHAHHLSHTHQVKKNGKTHYKRHEVK